MSNQNELSTTQKGKSKRMVVGLEVQAALSMRKEKIHETSLKQVEESTARSGAREIRRLWQKQRGGGTWTLPLLPVATAWASEPRAEKHLGGTLLLRRL